MKAFIPAAGLGTRLKPITDNIPKALIEINGIPLIEILIKHLMKAGIKEIIINVHHFSKKIISFLASQNNYGITIEVSNESDKLLDTGGGLKKAAWFLSYGQPFLVHNVDILSDIDIVSLYRFHFRGDAIITLAVQKRESSRYLLFDDEKNLCGWKNNKTHETIMARSPKGGINEFAFSGIYIADPKIFYLMPDKNVFSIIDLFLAVARDHKITYFDHSGSLFIDLGKPENLAKAEELFI